MRFSRLLTLVAPALFIFAIISCDKEDDPNDTEKPVMSISLPTENQVIDLSVDSLHILLNVTENDKLKSFTATLKANDVIIYTDSPADAAGVNYYIYHRHFNPPGITANTTAQLTLVAEDKSGNTDTRTINFSFIP